MDGKCTKAQSSKHIPMFFRNLSFGKSTKKDVQSALNNNSKTPGDTLQMKNMNTSAIKNASVVDTSHSFIMKPQMVLPPKRAMIEKKSPATPSEVKISILPRKPSTAFTDNIRSGKYSAAESKTEEQPSITVKSKAGFLQQSQKFRNPLSEKLGSAFKPPQKKSFGGIPQASSSSSTSSNNHSQFKIKNASTLLNAQNPVVKNSTLAPISTSTIKAAKKKNVMQPMASLQSNPSLMMKKTPSFQFQDTISNEPLVLARPSFSNTIDSNAHLTVEKTTSTSSKTSTLFETTKQPLGKPPLHHESTKNDTSRTARLNAATTGNVRQTLADPKMKSFSHPVVNAPSTKKRAMDDKAFAASNKTLRTKPGSSCSYALVIHRDIAEPEPKRHKASIELLNEENSVTSSSDIIKATPLVVDGALDTEILMLQSEFASMLQSIELFATEASKIVTKNRSTARKLKMQVAESFQDAVLLTLEHYSAGLSS